MLAIQFDGAKAIDDAIGRLPQQITGAAARAINRTLDSTRVFMVNRLNADTGLPTIILDQALTTTKATAAQLEGELSARTKPAQKLIPILQLHAVQVGRGPNVPGGVTYQFAGQLKTLPNAFIAKMQSGHVGVFQRVPRQFMREQKPSWKVKREKIREKFSPSLRTVFGRSEDDGLAFADRELGVNAEQELEKVAASV